MNEGAEARRYLRARRHGVLSTLSQKLGGYPFGSVVPYVLDHQARPLILISRLAEHTRNIEADSRVSLLVGDATDDVQSGARLTFVGDAGPAGGDSTALQARYLNYEPGARRLIALGDFSFYAIQPRALRFIGGFGDIRWIGPAAYSPPAGDLAAQEGAIITRVNMEHAADLRDCCRFRYRSEAAVAVMIGIDCDGFDVRADGELLRFDFERTVTDAASARAALLALAERARAS